MSTIFRQQHTLATASRYANPLNPDDILPVVYGAFYVTSPRTFHRWRCPCIDTVNKIYLIADHPIVSVANGNSFNVSINNTLQTSGYTVTPSGADENGKTIAYVTFTSSPGDNAVNISCAYGKSVGSTPYANVMGILADLVTAAGGSTADFDATNYAQEHAYAAAQGLRVGVILEHGSRLVQELVLEILASLCAESWLTPANTLKVKLPRATVGNADVLAFLNESECSGYSGYRDADLLINHVGFRRWWRPSTGQYFGAFAPYFDNSGAYVSAASVAKYGDRLRVFETPWLQDGRNYGETPVSTSLLARFAFPRWVVTFTVASPRFFFLERGDYVCWSWARLRDENGLPLVNQIGRVLHLQRRPLDNAMDITLIDTGAFYQATGGTRDRTRY